MPKTHTEPSLERSALCFKTQPFVLETPQEQNLPRQFKGVAYSGEVIEGHCYWDKVIFDLDSMKIATPLAALLEHDANSRVGVIKEFTKDYQQGLQVKGSFLNNDKAQAIINDSDADFPFQMSVYIEPEKVELVEKGEVVVNGRTVQTPITIFRGGTIREVSFCALGADSNTSAIAATHQPKLTKESDMDELKKAQDLQAKAEKEREKVEKERDKAVKELKEFKAKKREDDIAGLEKELNTQFSAEDKQAYLDMNEAGFAFTAKQLRQFSAKPSESTLEIPSHLFSHQAKANQTGSEPSAHKFTKGAQEFAKQGNKS